MTEEEKNRKAACVWVYNKQQSSTQTEWCHQNHCSDSFWTRQSKIDQNITLTSKCFQYTPTTHTDIPQHTKTSQWPLNYSKSALHNKQQAAQQNLTAFNIIYYNETHMYGLVRKKGMIKQYGLKHMWQVINFIMVLKYFYIIFRKSWHLMK